MVSGEDGDEIVIATTDKKFILVDETDDPYSSYDKRIPLADAIAAAPALNELAANLQKRRPAKVTSKTFGASCLGCFGILVLCVVVGWIAEIAGCNPETPHSDSYQAGFTVGKLEGFMAYRGGKYHASQEDLDASARRTMGGVQFDSAKGGLED